MAGPTINQALEIMGFNGSGTIGFSAHGFMTTASTLLHEIGYRPDVIERQLAHAEANQVRAAYNHAAYLVERREMMQALADSCLTTEEEKRMANWKELLTKELQENGESWDDVEANTMTEEEMEKCFDNGYGGLEGIQFTAWTKNAVYFPVCYDGSEWVGSVSRNPDGNPTPHHGGG